MLPVHNGVKFERVNVLAALRFHFVWSTELEQPELEVPDPDAPLVTLRFKNYKTLEHFFILNAPSLTRQELRTKVIGLALMVFKKPGEANGKT